MNQNRLKLQRLTMHCTAAVRQYRLRSSSGDWAGSPVGWSCQREYSRRRGEERRGGGGRRWEGGISSFLTWFDPRHVLGEMISESGKGGYTTRPFICPARSAGTDISNRLPAQRVAAWSYWLVFSSLFEVFFFSRRKEDGKMFRRQAYVATET